MVGTLLANKDMSIANEDKSKTCGMVFCRIEDLSAGMAPPFHHEQRVISYVKSKAKNGSSPQVQPQPQKSLLGKRKREDYLDGDIRNFRRVQIKRAAKSWTRCRLHELQGNDWVDLGTGSCHCLYSIVRASTSKICPLKIR